MITYQASHRLLQGPAPASGAEDFASHVERLGGLPSGARDLIPSLEASGVLGRGGAGFPVGRKWRSLADRSRGAAVVVVNGAEGEPRSAKDRVLMTLRPHLVVDGAILAAEAIGAEEIVFYVGDEHHLARATLGRAVVERKADFGRPVRMVAAPVGYISGEASAAVHYLNAGNPRPTDSPPRPSESGVRGRPTLVQNVESLAYAALIARFGQDWYRSAGRGQAGGTALVTISGGTDHPGVREIELGMTVGEVAALAGVSWAGIGAVLLGGYFGAWASADSAWDVALDPPAMRARGLAFGCGMLSFLPADTCGVSATAGIIGYMARESAGQCGPCVFGLRAVAGAASRLAAGRAGKDDLANVERWTGQIPGRGACRHPDGAVQMMVSGLTVFADEFRRHAQTGRCSMTGQRVDAV